MAILSFFFFFFFKYKNYQERLLIVSYCAKVLGNILLDEITSNNMWSVTPTRIFWRLKWNDWSDLFHMNNDLWITLKF